MLNIYKAYQQSANKNQFCFDNFVNTRSIKHVQVNYSSRTNKDELTRVPAGNLASAGALLRTTRNQAAVLR